MMWTCALLLCSIHLAIGSYVGMPCTVDDDCHQVSFMSHSSCDASQCRCDPGYYGSDGQYYCLKVKIGTPCTTNEFCDAGVLGSVCDKFRVCSCPDGTGEVSQISLEVPFCAAIIQDPECDICEKTGGICYSTENETDCGCPCPFAPSKDPLFTGCDVKQARTGELCYADGSIVCVDPNAECSHDSTLSSRLTCTCKTGYVAVRNTADPINYICARRLSADADKDCAVCIANSGECYDVEGDNVMDGCECPMGRTSPTSAIEDACRVQHFHVDCTKDNMTVCITGEQNYDNFLATTFDAMYAENYKDYLYCNLRATQTGVFCLTLNYDSVGDNCGLNAVESEASITYSLWVTLQQASMTLSAYDVCIYNYCTYHKKAQSATGVIDVIKRKLTTSQGVTVKPTVDMSIINKFREDVELVGGTLGEQVKLIIDISDNKDVYTSLRAEVCVVSNMLSLDHPHVQSAVFILDACPYGNNLLNNPKPVFVDDPNNPLRIFTNYFPLPKLSTDVIFFQCCVKVCIKESDCAPRNCTDDSRRKRTVAPSPSAALRLFDGDDTLTTVIAVSVDKSNPVSDIEVMDNRPVDLNVRRVGAFEKFVDKHVIWILSGTIFLVFFGVVAVYVFVARKRTIRISGKTDSLA